MKGEERLLRALREAPRRYRMPPLPGDADSLAPEAALAVAIECARTGHDPARELFARSLAALITQSLRSDPALQAQVLREEQPRVAEYAALAAQEASDRKAIRSRVDAFAHPGKLHGRGGDTASLAELHALSRAQGWHALRAKAHALVFPQRDALLADTALARLERITGLREDAAVQRYLALCAAQGPAAGSEAAAATGRAAARAGEAVEAQTLRAFEAIARALDPQRYRAVQGLRPSAGLPPAPRGAKDEWDVALLRAVDGSDAFDIVLLAECKAAPLAATGDWPRLLAGLRRLSQVDAQQDCGFATSGATLRVRGASLRALAPEGDALPPPVFYACSSMEERIPLLAPAARALLLQQPEAIAFARAPEPERLARLFDRLQREPRLRPVLQQYETSRRAREAMLHPDDLLACATEIAT